MNSLKIVRKKVSGDGCFLSCSSACAWTLHFPQFIKKIHHERAVGVIRPRYNLVHCCHRWHCPQGSLSLKFWHQLEYVYGNKERRTPHFYSIYSYEQIRELQKIGICKFNYVQVLQSLRQKLWISKNVVLNFNFQHLSVQISIEVESELQS